MIELYVRWRIGGTGTEEFIGLAQRWIEAVRPLSGTLRCDWFLHDAGREAVAMFALRGTDDLRHFLTAARELEAALASRADAQWHLLGHSTDAVAQLAPRPLTVLHFDSGLDAESGAARLHRHIEPRPARQHIEIFTRFVIEPGQQAEFRRHAAECLTVVKARDPGTSRYDWLYDARGSLAIALDTYADTAGMLAHMRNCHAPHSRLLDVSRMTTEFLGELDPQARTAIAKYDPFVLRWIGGLKPWSSGGYG